ncbi:MAG: integrin alpha [Deltaproteobacteria bacterium]|nr:integrin alpha [Deltaproteobacteria bacterium]
MRHRWEAPMCQVRVMLGLSGPLLSLSLLGLAGCDRGRDGHAPRASAPKPVPATTRQTPKNSNRWLNDVQERIANEEYRVARQDDWSFAAANRAHNLRARFRDGAARIEPRESVAGQGHWAATLAVTGFGREGAVLDVDRGEARSGACDDKAGPGATDECLKRLEIVRDGLVEWWGNWVDGMEQGFDVAERPEGVGELAIRVEVEGLEAKQDGPTGALLRQNGELRLAYSGLSAKDSAGKALPARMAVGADSILFFVDDDDATYPVVIDPLLTSPAWTAESDQAGAQFGYSVASAGDVNGDGFSDVIIGAPYYDGLTDEGAAFVFHGSSSGLSTSANWTVKGGQASALFGNSVASAGDVNGDGYEDVIVGAYAFDNGQTDEGRVFVYHGSSTGLSTTPAWTAESDQASAEFGISVSSAGDVNSDGYADVIVGAHKFANGQAAEGRAYVYHGSASGRSATANWTAEGDQIGAHFGTAVASAGDVNGDGYTDVIIGAPDYDKGITDEGAAFVFHGSASGLSSTYWIAGSMQANSNYGGSVSSAGDANGDGYADVIVGARNYDNGQTDEGRVFFYKGGPDGLSPSADWTNESNQANSGYGKSVAGAGDVNGDGYSDFIVSAHRYDNGQTDEGRVFVYYGSASSFSSTGAWTVESDQAEALLGNSVSSAGDVNGDGYYDIIIGSSYYDNGQTDEGRAYVYYGSAAGLATSSGWTAESNQANAVFGYSVSSAGDVNGDGYADVIVGADYYSNGQTGEGRAYIYHGAASGLSTTAAWSDEGNEANALFGKSVSAAGDVNGDGYGDVIVGAPSYGNGQSGEGRAFVYHGSTSGLSATPDWTAEGDQVNAWFGFSVAAAGDVNGDGYGDIIVGANQYDNDQTNEGRAFVFHGSVSGLSAAADWTAESDQADAEFGRSVASAGDVNGDGYGDVVVGAPYYDNGQTDEGRAYVYYGSATGLAATANWIKESDQPNYALGYSVSSAGDVNGDGYGDVIVGAPNPTGNGNNNGFAYVFYGSASGLGVAADWTASVNPVNFGMSVATAGDVNGDGYSDVVIGSPRYGNGQTLEGRAYVYHGSASGLATTAGWGAESNQASASYGWSVASAGDVNGDGYSDIVIGSYMYDNGQSNEGRAFLYYGNGGAGLSVRPRQFNADGDPQMQAFAKAETGNIQIQIPARSDRGRTKVKLEYEIQPHTTPFDGTGLRRSASWTDTGNPADGVNDLTETVSGLSGGDYHWRARLVYHPSSPGGGEHSRWIVYDRIGSWQPDFRISVEKKPDGETCGGAGECLSGNCVAGTCCFDPCATPPDCKVPPATCPGGTACSYENAADATQCLGGGGLCKGGECVTNECYLGAWYASGQPTEGCKFCDPATSRTAWTDRPNTYPDSCGTAACPADACSGGAWLDYGASCQLTCNGFGICGSSCACTPATTACSAAGCCQSACAPATGCYTTAGSCGGTDTCNANVLTVGNSCTGCALNGAIGACAGGATYTCNSSVHPTCESRSCNGATYYCTNGGGIWQWRTGTGCDDGALCTYGDACGGGTCSGTAVSCTDTACVDRTCNGTSACAESYMSGSTSCGATACPADSCTGLTWHNYAATCTRYCNGSGNCNTCSCAPVDVTCTAGGCCQAACDAATGCSSAAGSCADVCGATTLEVARTCSGCGANGASGTCAGTTHACSAGKACAQVTCGGTAYTCTNDGGTWQWRASAACNDGNACTYNDTCSGGACQGQPITCTSDTCMTRTCNGTSTCTENAAILGTPCGTSACQADACDGLVFENYPATCNRTCDGDGTCQTCTCTATTTSCAAGSGCCTAICNPTTGCATQPGTCGGGGDTCGAEVLTVGQVCNGCGSNGAEGTCVAGGTFTCSDAVHDECELASCGGNPLYCVEDLIDGWGWNTDPACDDGDACTHDDACAGGACAGTPMECVSDACKTRACNGTSECDEQDVDAGTPCGAEDCPADSCGGTTWSDYPAACERACDGAGACAGCECQPMTDACSASGCCQPVCVNATGCATVAGTCADACGGPVMTVARTCSGCGADGAAGACSGADHACDALVECEARSCGGHMYYCTNVGGIWSWRQGLECDDGEPCTYGDRCSGDVCQGTSITCQSDACMARSCDGTASCAETPKPDTTSCGEQPCPTGGCSSGSWAAYDKTCDVKCDGAGSCEATCDCEPVEEQTCTASGCCDAACSNALGCYTVAGTCSGTDTCAANLLVIDPSCAGCGPNGANGTCGPSGSYACTDADHAECDARTCGGTLYYCTNAGGTWAWRASAACVDGDDCTYGDSCGAGACAGVALTCDDGNCLDRYCDGSSTCGESVLENGEPCDDGNPLTDGDECIAGGVCAGLEAGGCDLPIEAALLPFAENGSTTGRSSHVNDYGELCGGYVQPASDVVYEVDLHAGDELRVTVTPDAGFNTAIRLIAACADGLDCLGSRNAAGAGGEEVLDYTTTGDGAVTVVVEGVGTGANGDYHVDIRLLNEPIDAGGDGGDAATDTDTDSDSDSDADADSDVDSDTDADTDADSDTDADADTDGDADTDTDTDTGTDTHVDTGTGTDGDGGGEGTDSRMGGSTGSHGCGCSVIGA